MVSMHFKARARRIVLRTALGAAILGGAGGMAQKLLMHAEEGEEVSFTELADRAHDLTVSSIHIDDGMALGEGVSGRGHSRRYHTPMPDKYEPTAIVNEFLPAKVTFGKKSWWADESGPLWLAAVGGVGLLLLAYADSRKNALERNVVELMRFRPEENKTTFKDLAGMESILPEAKKIACSIKGEKPYHDHGSTPAKGILIAGDEGSGKTLLAEAIAHEARASLFSVAATSLKSPFHGNPATQINALVKAALENAPSLVLVRGIDAIARKDHSDEDENVLMELFKQMDACLKYPVQFVFTTDKPDRLDPRFDRSGRCDQKLYMPKQDLQGREEILELYARKHKLAADVDLKTVAYNCFDFSPADLERVVNEAARLAEDEPDAEEITNGHLNQAVETIRQDGRKPPIMTDNQKRIAATHKAGHALAAILLEKQGCPQTGRLTLAAHERVSSIEEIHQQETGAPYTRKDFETALVFLFSGGVSEEIIGGDPKAVSTAGSEDIAKATQFAVDMVTCLGFSKLGHMLIGGQPDTRGHEFEPAVKTEVDAEIKRILTEARDEAKKLLEPRKGILMQMTHALLAKETLSPEELRALADPIGAHKAARCRVPAPTA